MTVAEVAADVVVPDSIEAVEEWRTWQFDGTNLVSITNGTVWKAGEALKAVCQGHADRWEWTLVPNGSSREQVAEMVKQQRAAHQQTQAAYSTFGNPYFYASGSWWPDAPRVEPPPGQGYILQQVRHDAPNANCTCGIYAGRTAGDCPSGDVLGKVKLWGTLVPGEKGSRAEFAYPSELHVPPKLANSAALLAYGVPLIVVEADEIAASTQPGPSSRKHRNWWLNMAIAMNVGACALNLGLLAARTWL